MFKKHVLCYTHVINVAAAMGWMITFPNLGLEWLPCSKSADLLGNWHILLIIKIWSSYFYIPTRGNHQGARMINTLTKMSDNFINILYYLLDALMFVSGIWGNQINVWSYSEKKDIYTTFSWITFPQQSYNSQNYKDFYEIIFYLTGYSLGWNGCGNMKIHLGSKENRD